MARNISLIVSNGVLAVGDFDTDTSKFNAQYNGGFGGISYDVLDASMVLTAADDQINLSLPNGHTTGFFKWSEIGTADINGVDQLATATDLAGIISAFSSFFFEPGYVSYELVAGVTTIDYGLCGKADLVYLITNEAAPTSWTISKITNMPNGKMATFMVPSNSSIVTVTLDRVTLANLTADGMMHGISDIVLEPKNEFATMQGLNNGTYNVVATVALSTSLT